MFNLCPFFRLEKCGTSNFSVVFWGLLGVGLFCCFSGFFFIAQKVDISTSEQSGVEVVVTCEAMKPDEPFPHQLNGKPFMAMLKPTWKLFARLGSSETRSKFQSKQGLGFQVISITCEKKCRLHIP